MINLLGEENHQGVPVIEGLEEVFKTEGAHLHWYGKKQTRPHRKMGHITCTAKTLDKARSLAKNLRKIVKVIS
jgi:5-(carboxyamino)imidazole ribonucleotide synthase